MDLKLAGKRALVTGSSSGIGAGIAECLAEEGAAVMVHGRDPGRAEGVADRIRQRGGTAHAAIGDIATDAGAAEVATAVQERLGGADILVNCAGGIGDIPLTWDNTTPELFVEQYELNTVSAIRMVNQLVPAMRQAGWGRIIQISSIAGVRPLADAVPAYCAAKAALPALGVSLAKTLAGTGITVNTVSPGYVAAASLKSFMMADPAFEGMSWEEVEPIAARQSNILVGRFGLPEDVARLVVFLASPLAEWITGSNFRIDGGMTGVVD